MPATRDTYVNPLLTDLYVGYSNPSYVYKDLAPTITVEKETGTYFVRDKENLRSATDAKRGEFGAANLVENTLSPATYTVQERSLATRISDRMMANYSDPFDPKKNATMLVSEKMALDKEKTLQSTILAAASGSNSVDLATAWATTTTDILGAVRTGRDTIAKSTGQKANTAIVPRPSLNAILKNQAIVSALQYTTVPTDSNIKNALSQFFDVPNVIIADGINNTSKEGQADVLDWIWGKNVVLAYVNPTPAIESTSALYQLQMRDNGNKFTGVDEWYDQSLKTTFVRASDYYTFQIVDPGALYIFLNTN